MSTDTELLRQYVKDGSEAAFTELVQRHIGLVYSVALRSVGGRGYLADEVTQNVFILLVRKAPRLIEHETLAGWLHTTTRYVSFGLVRTLRRQETLEQEAATMQTNSAPELQWEQLRPLLDEAVGQLDECDRNAVLLRYYQGQSHRQVGAALGLKEDAARVRTERAVEKLRRHFARSGVVTTSLLLAEALSANAAHAAPAGLVGKVTTASFAHAQGLGLGHALIKTFYMTTKSKIITSAAVIVALLAIPLYQQHQKIAQLSEQLAAVQHNTRSANGKNYAASMAGDTKHPLTQDEILAKIKAVEKGGGDFLKRWQAFIDSLSPSDIPNVLACLEQLNLANNSHRFLGPLLTFWAKSDPQAALAYVDKNVPAGRARNSAVEALLAGWVDKDPAAAAAWWQQLPSGQLRTDSAQTIVGTFLNSSDPKAAYQLTMSTDPNTRSTLIQGVFMSWGKTDPAGALAQIAQMPTGQLHELAISDFAEGYEESDPEAAFNWANSLPEGDDKNQVFPGRYENSQIPIPRRRRITHSICRRVKCARIASRRLVWGCPMTITSKALGLWPNNCQPGRTSKPPRTRLSSSMGKPTRRGP